MLSPPDNNDRLIVLETQAADNFLQGYSCCYSAAEDEILLSCNPRPQEHTRRPSQTKHKNRKTRALRTQNPIILNSLEPIDMLDPNTQQG